LPIGAGTALNVAAVLVGASIGAIAGAGIPRRVADVITDALGLVTFAVAVLSLAAVTDAALLDAVGRGAPFLIVLGALVIGGVIGSLLRIEERLEGFGELLRRRLGNAGGDTPERRRRFIDGFVTASLVFCVGPLTVLGSLQDGLGEGIELLALKSALDFFAALAFAVTFGWGVAGSALTVLVVQATLTAVGALLGETLNAAAEAALTATGGLLLVGVSLRLLRIKPLPVGDLLPALLIAPALAAAVAALR
jgi:uncharacterized membrane protein YqgA involved in biofilm formation